MDVLNGHESKIKVILFDLDNTLIATRYADELTCDRISVILQSYDIPEETSKQICKNFLREFRKCPQHSSMSLDVWRQQLWHRALTSRYNKYSDEIYKHWLHLRYRYLQINHQTIELLKKLRKKYLLGLITNGPSEAQWEKITNLNVQPYFDVVLVSGDLPWEKPNEKIFGMACDYLGVRPENCLMIGDKLETDVLGGIQAHLAATIWLNTTNNLSDMSNISYRPSFVIKHLTTDLPNVLKKLQSNSKSRRNSKDNLFLRPYVCPEPDLSDCNSNGSDGS